MFGLGMGELVVILIIVFLLFGATRLPEMGKGIGLAIRNFKKSINEPDSIDVTPQKPPVENKEEKPSDNKTA